MSRLPGAAVAASAGVAAYWIGMSSQSQLLGRFPRRGDVDSALPPTVALTFDDGPNEPFTSRIAALLRERDVRATFFQVGAAVARSPDSSRALLEAGHVLGNHSYTHRFSRCFTPASIEDEVRRTQDVFAEQLEVVPRLYRPPWLARTPATFAVLRRHRLQPVSGTFCHPFEVAQPAARRIARCAASRSRAGSMMIFHDGYNGGSADRTQTLDAVARLVDAIADRGWSFVTVDTMLGVEPYAAPAARGAESPGIA